MDAIEWNQRWLVGTRVRLTKADGEVVRTRTVSPAQRWGGLDHVAVAGITGYVMLSWCEPEDAGDTTTIAGGGANKTPPGPAGRGRTLAVRVDPDAAIRAASPRRVPAALP